MVSVWLSRLKLPLTLIVLQIVFTALFAVFVDYGDSAKPAPFQNGTDVSQNGGGGGKNELHDYYPMFQDVHVMIFIGFGMLMVFLRRYGFSSMGVNMLLGAICIQWATLIGGLIHHKGHAFTIGVGTMLTSDFATAAVLITFGAMLGKTSPLQMVIIAILEIAIFAVNEYIGIVILEVVDIGGSMFVHAFGAYFGLAMSRVLYRPDVERSEKEGSIYHSDLFASLGSVFLWMFWPSFNSALAVDDAQHRAVLNTYYALAACCLVSFAISALVDKDGRFDMVHIQNATLAGGVAVGTSADMMIQPYGAVVIGSLAGFLSVIGYKYITPFLSSRLKIHDTCGVNNLHGMPAIMAGITGAIVVAMADVDTYGVTLYRQFPAMAPKNESLVGFLDASPGKGRSASEQAVYQLIALGVTLAVALVGGVIVGLILKVCSFLGQPSGDRLFEDSPHWHVPDEVNAMAPLVNQIIAELEKQKTIYKYKGDAGVPLLAKGDNLALDDRTNV